MDWDLISFITSSKIRFKLLTTLNKRKNTPTELSKILDVHISAISRALSELAKNNLKEQGGIDYLVQEVAKTDPRILQYWTKREKFDIGQAKQDLLKMFQYYLS